MNDRIRSSDSSPAFELSEAGIARKNRMLSDLVGEMNRVHSFRRNRRRAMMVIAPIAVFALALAWWRSPARTVAPSSVGEFSARAPNGVSESASSGDSVSAAVPIAIITLIHTTDDALDACRVKTASKATSAESIDDVELLATLATLNRPAGLVRSGERVWLTRNVTDL